MTVPINRVHTQIDSIKSRADLRRAQRIVIKAGTSTIVDGDGYPSLRRISQIAEDICALRRKGMDIIFVSSGAVGVGRNVLRRQLILGTSAFDRLHGTERSPMGENSLAAAGMASLVGLYQTLFGQLDITVSELLLTKHDFETDDRKANLSDTIESLLHHGIVPIVNENDAVTAGARRITDPFNDNDGLASLVARQMKADLIVLLTDVDGVYDRPPSDPQAKLFSTFPGVDIQFGEKSKTGRGGMQAKIAAAQTAVDCGVPAAVIASGEKQHVLRKIAAGERVGTMFVEEPDTVIRIELAEDSGPSMSHQADECRAGSRALQALTTEERSAVLRAVADAIDRKREKILAANAEDLSRERERGQLAVPLMKRLELGAQKIDTLVAGIRSIAEAEEPIGKVLSRMELSAGVELTKVTVPIGVLLVIFESRPDSLPQIAALSLRSGNGLLLKGGREAERSNEALHSVITEAVATATGGRVKKGVIGLVTSRAEIGALLALDKHIDLVIPRGSNALVKHIQANTNIPVLGHADGVCHVYVHPTADVALARRILVDAKTNYPAACNAAETVLLDARLGEPAMVELVGALREAGVEVLGSRRAVEAGLASEETSDFHVEFGENKATVHIVDDVAAAAEHINAHGSHHTEAIVSADDAADAEVFLRSVDSACVFRNASTRMADGYRLGLGAEVGISTGRIHARGPVGVEGLLSQKWVIRGEAGATVATAAAYASGESVFTHKALAP